MQPEENATSIRHLLNHDSCFAHADSFRRMKRTSFTVSDLDGWDKMQARRFLPERAYICLPCCWKILPLSFFFFFFFFFFKKERSIVERKKGSERESLSFFFFFLTIPVCHHSGHQSKRKHAADTVDPICFTQNFV